MICDKSNRHRKLVSKVFRMFGKKKSRLYGLVSATFILGQIILPSTSFATELDFEGYASYEDATEEGAKSLGGKLATGFNWENASGAILSALGGVPVPGSTTAKYTFQAFGCGGFAICRMSPSDVEMNQKYSAQCAFVGTGAAYPIPPVYWVHGIAKGGTNETKPMATTLWHPGGPHHPPYICGGIIAKISFSAYEGANGIGPADAEAGTIGDMTELEQSPDKETGEVGDFEIGDANFDSEKYTNCIYDKCIGDTGNADDYQDSIGNTGDTDWKWNGGDSNSPDNPGGRGSTGWSSDGSDGSGSTGDSGDGHSIEEAVERGFAENGGNSYGASDKDWSSSGGGSSGSSDLGDYFGTSGGGTTGDGSFGDGTFNSGSDFGTLDDDLGTGDTYSSGTGFDANGDGTTDAWDTNGDGIPDAWDTDGDGVADAWDTNGDGKADTWDSNGDGIADQWDTNGDGQVDAWDTNGDGKPDAWDTDGDGIPDAWDTDGDGIPDAWDTDGDGMPDKFAGDGDSSDFSDADVNGFDNGMFGSLYNNLFGGDGEGNSLLGNISNMLGSLSSSLLGGETKTASDADMYNIAHGLLNDLGYSDEDIRNGKNYDSGSAYTDPKKAWDMNRITTLMSKHRLHIGTDGNVSKPTKDDLKGKKTPKTYTQGQGGALSSALANAPVSQQEQAPQTAQNMTEEEKETANQTAESSSMVPQDAEARKQWMQNVFAKMTDEQKTAILNGLSDKERADMGF